MTSNVWERLAGVGGLQVRCRYTDFLLEVLRKEELFLWLGLVPSVFWHSLLFRDRFNYLGIKAELPEGVQQCLGSYIKAALSGPNVLSPIGLAAAEAGLQRC